MNIQRRERDSRACRFAWVFLSMGAGIALPVAVAASIPVGGPCMLVDAVTAANTDTAAGGCPAGSGPDVLVLTENVTLTAVVVSDIVAGDTGLPRGTSEITIEGNDFFVQHDTTGPPFRIFWVGNHGSLTLRRVTVRNGVATLSEGGGAVLLSGDVGQPTPILRVEESTLTNNRGNIGGAVSSQVADEVVIVRSTISENTADHSGGGVHCQTAVRISESTVSGNVAMFGGGIRTFITYSVTIENTSISDNEASSSGGGLSIGEGAVTAINTTISGNLAGTRGGGLDFQDVASAVRQR